MYRVGGEVGILPDRLGGGDNVPMGQEACEKKSVTRWRN